MLATVVRRVNSRKEANTSSVKFTPFEVGAEVKVLALKHGEEYRGSSIWFVDDKGIHLTSHAVSLNFQSNKLSTLIDYFPALWNIAFKKVIKIGVFDSGVTKGSSLLGERVIQLNHDNSSIVEHHGDYMSTIIAGSDFDKGYFGFLPNAQIYSFKADVDAGFAVITPKYFTDALQAFLDHNVDVVNISMASVKLKSFFETDETLRTLLNEFKKRNIPLVASAGNEHDIDDNGDLHYPARLGDFLSVSGYFINGSAVDFDFTLNLWSGLSLLSPSFPVYPPEYFQNFDIKKPAGSSVSCAITTGILGILKCYFSMVNSPSVSFRDFYSSVLSSMPAWKTDPIFSNINSGSFKYLDFNSLKKSLNL